MKNHPHHPVRLVPVLMCAIILMQGQPATGEDMNPPINFTITRQNNPWQGFTSTGEEERNTYTVRAQATDAAGFLPLPALKAYDRNGAVLVARSEKERRSVINAAFFSDLARVNATRGYAEPVAIGMWKDPAFAYMSARELACFLVESCIVQTYAHVESRLELWKEEEDQASYRGWFKGIHIYFTNSRNESALAFSIRIDKATGAMEYLGE